MYSTLKKRNLRKVLSSVTAGGERNNCKGGKKKIVSSLVAREKAGKDNYASSFKEEGDI